MNDGIKIICKIVKLANFLPILIDFEHYISINQDSPYKFILPVKICQLDPRPNVLAL